MEIQVGGGKETDERLRSIFGPGSGLRIRSMNGAIL